MSSRIQSRPVTRIGLKTTAARARLSFYPPGLRQAAHVHEKAHISVIVAGGIRENSGRRDEEAFSSAFHVRPAGARHEVTFGPHGALILAIDLESTSKQPATGWVNRPISPTQRQLLHHLLGRDAMCDSDVDDYLQDLIAAVEREPLIGRPPSWLIRARDRMIEEPATAIADLARDAGVHRAHFSRAFSHWLKMPPSLFRRRVMVSRAIAAAIGGGSVAGAAQIAGFADQSHLCRSFRDVVGVTPRLLLAAVDATSVQYGAGSSA